MKREWHDPVVRLAAEFACRIDVDGSDTSARRLIEIIERLIEERGSAGRPPYNHTRGDSALTPCPLCAESKP
jgi:hypothetical protein